MNPINDKNLSQRLVAYIFGNLSSQEEKQLDSYIQEHPEAAEMAEALSAYCYRENLQHPDQLQDRLSADRQFFLKQKKTIYPPPPKQKTIPTWRWAAAAAAIILIAFWGWKWLHTPTVVEFDYQIYAFHAKEAPRLEEAGGDKKTWEATFIAKDFQQTFFKLDRKFKENPREMTDKELFFLSVLYTWQKPLNQEGVDAVLLYLENGIYINDAKAELKKAKLSQQE